MQAAAAGCRRLNARFTGLGLARWNPQTITRITAAPPRKPTRGEMIIGMTTFLTITCQCTVVDEARPAPISPPMSECVEDDGSPKYQVMRFQAIAPRSAAARITRRW